jgi:hypothetical protein
LKRHQKLHRCGTEKASKRSIKSVKRERTASACDTSTSTESSADQSPVQEVTEPQFCYDTLAAWEVPTLNSTLASNAFWFPESDESDQQSSWFEENYLPIDEDSIGNSFVKPEEVWDEL